MLENMFGDMQAKQEAMKKELAELQLQEEAGGLKITINGNREILNVSIDKDQIDLSDSEELEDMLVVTLNRALEKAALAESEASQKLANDMLPGGLGNLFG